MKTFQELPLQLKSRSRIGSGEFWD